MNYRLFNTPTFSIAKTIPLLLILYLINGKIFSQTVVNNSQNFKEICTVIYEVDGEFFEQTSSKGTITSLTDGSTLTDPAQESVRIYKITYSDTNNCAANANLFDIYPERNHSEVTELNSEIYTTNPNLDDDDVGALTSTEYIPYSNTEYEATLEDILSIPDIRSYWTVNSGAENVLGSSGFVDFLEFRLIDEITGNQTFFDPNELLLVTERDGNSPMNFVALDQNGDPISTSVDDEVQISGSGTLYQWDTTITHDVDTYGNQEQWLILFEANLFNANQDIYGFDVNLETSFADGSVLGFRNPGTLLLNGDCWRMLSSSPFQDVTFAEILDPIWTQGIPGSDEPNAIGSNVFLWNNNESGNTTSGWTTSGLDLSNEVPLGTGFLVSVFDDDNYDEPGGTGFPKELSIKGIENTGPIEITTTSSNPSSSARMNANADGWTLLGNPFGAPLIFSKFTGKTETSGIRDVAYVYDRNWATSQPDTDSDSPGPTNGNIGGWRTTDGTYGDIEDGRIAPFQGFFVQNNNNTSSQVTFEESDRGSLTFDPDDSIEDEWYFYGKNKNKDQSEGYFRLYVEGEQTYNSAWITLSDRGSTQPTNRDAYELEPFTENFSMLSTRKGDELFDIGHFPNDEQTTIPLNLETTLSGTYKLKITESNLIGSDLVFIDTQENVTLPLNENFEYEFKIRQAAKANPDPLRCGATGQELASKFKPKKAKVTSTEDRFIIQYASAVENPGGGETPSQVQLKQNYPNPFNPTTQISYQLSQQSNVLLEVYDLTGKLITTLVNETVSSGTHSVTFDAANLSSGVYMYRLQTANQVLSKKLTVIK